MRILDASQKESANNIMPDIRRHPCVRGFEGLHKHQDDNYKKSKETHRPYLYHAEKTVIFHENTTVVRPGGLHSSSQTMTKRERQLIGDYSPHARKSLTNSRGNYGVVEKDHAKQAKQPRARDGRYATDHEITVADLQRSRGEKYVYPDDVDAALEQVQRDHTVARQHDAKGFEPGNQDYGKSHEDYKYYPDHTYYGDHKNYEHYKGYEEHKDHEHHEHYEKYKDYEDRKGYENYEHYEDYEDHENYGDCESHGAHEDYEDYEDYEDHEDYEAYEDSGDFEDFEDYEDYED